MCRLFFISSKKAVKLDKMFLEFLKLSRKNNDGWGLAFFNKGQLSLVKEPIAAYQSETPKLFFNSVKSRLFLGHLRKAWIGKNKYVNTHPFVCKIDDKEWVFAHNGSLYKKDTKYTERLFNTNIQGETDSERFFAHVMEEMKNRGEDKLKEILLEANCMVYPFQDYSIPNKNGGLNYILTDGKKLYVHRKNRPLCYLQEDGKITICSQPISKENWKEFPEDTLFVVENGIMKKL